MKPSHLPLVRPFDQAYEAWSYRRPTAEEFTAAARSDQFSPYVRDVLLRRVTNEFEAALHIAASDGVDNGLEHHIDNALARDAMFKKWLDAMPVKMPPILDKYQLAYPLDDYRSVDKAIRRCGVALTPRQVLFHGGHLALPDARVLQTTRPLSTTFCPQVALREAEFDNKAYDADMICLNVLRVFSSNAMAFVFDRNKSQSGHEKEVLFSSGIQLKLRFRLALRENYTVYRSSGLEQVPKQVRFYVCQMDIY